MPPFSRIHSAVAREEPQVVDHVLARLLGEQLAGDERGR
jgi:hypothetical protein